MEVTIRKMGNSQGVLIPKPILAQVGLEGKALLTVHDEARQYFRVIPPSTTSSIPVTYFDSSEARNSEA